MKDLGEVKGVGENGRPVGDERLGSRTVWQAPPRCTTWYNVAVYGAISLVLECIQDISLPLLSTQSVATL